MVDGTLVYHWLFKAEAIWTPAFAGGFRVHRRNRNAERTNNLDEIHGSASSPPGRTEPTGYQADCAGQTATLTFAPHRRAGRIY